jgi:hypothetical protein
MLATTFQPALNPIQLHLLEMFNFNRDEEAMNELKTVLYDYYKKKVQTATTTLAVDYGMDNVRIEEVLNMHLRTPYK